MDDSNRQPIFNINSLSTNDPAVLSGGAVTLTATGVTIAAAELAKLDVLYISISETSAPSVGQTTLADDNLTREAVEKEFDRSAAGDNYAISKSLANAADLVEEALAEMKRE